ncbi:hypothetical protein [Agrobacterium vitis]|uniref:hypothetical protein n=1 Tax=Agrobacterium vitis TaxID=373 RepID=UPI0013AA6036|nr:hypothetical protein [Agrobacterium vitis]MVA61770.1 hypothetical protein [Agrobacterium vitis]BCH58949.1 hypothetical protein RvVAR0630_15730 [Agrobacterium vitis]
MTTIITISSEDDAWRVLSDILNDKIDAEDVELDFGDAAWAKVHLNFKGDIFHQTVTASMMRGIVEYQAAFYRTAALLIKDDARVNRLTDQEKDDLELIFKVEEGSSELNADAAEQLKGVLGKCVDKMGSKQVFATALVVALLFFGSPQVANYLNNDVEKTRIETAFKEETARIEAETKRQEIASTERRDTLQVIKDLVQENKRKTDLLEQAYKESAAAKHVGELNREAVGEIIRNSSKADEITIQGVTLQQNLIREITRSQRSSSQDVTIQDEFQVVGVVSEDDYSFVVRLQRVSTGEIIVATLDDPLLSARHHKAIQQAEWKRAAVVVKISARKVGDSYKDAKILRAFTPRKRS